MKICFNQLIAIATAAIAALLAVEVMAQPPYTEDPDLEAGFPVSTFDSSGSYRAGPGIHTLVGNIDNDPRLEIVVTALANGPLYAWHSDGSLVTGWPLTVTWGADYPAMGNLSNAFPGFEIVAGHFTYRGLEAYSGSGTTLSGWPVTGDWHASPPALADVNGDGIDEIFTEAQNWALNAYAADGSPLPGWPASGPGGQQRFTPAIADLDGDGDLELVTASGQTSEGGYLFAYHHNGTPVDGFPIQFSSYAQTFPVIGDVDADGEPEIVHLAQSGDTAFFRVYVRSANGSTERTWTTLGNLDYGTQPTLADLDGDSVPEIIVQASDTLTVMRGDGTTFPGWPVLVGGGDGNSAPVVGDVNGDLQPEIVVETVIPSPGILDGEVRVYNRNGVLDPRFPKTLPIGRGAVPAIADIDLDGRNEIVVAGNSKVWAYDLGLCLCSSVPHGQIEWGQFGAGPRHQGHYVPPITSTTLLINTSASSNTVTVGDPLTYTITVTNMIAMTITDLILTDTLPTNAVFGSVTSSQGSCSQASNIINCNLDSLASSTSFTVRVVITPTLAGIIGNAVNVAGNETGTDWVNYTTAQCIINTVNPDEPPPYRYLFLPIVLKYQ